jgi:hypothetical protein
MHVYIYIYIYVCMYMHVCLFEYMSTRTTVTVDTCRQCMHAYTYIHAYMHTCIHAYGRAYISIWGRALHMYMYMHIHIYMYMYISAYIYVCIHARRLCTLACGKAQCLWTRNSGQSLYIYVHIYVYTQTVHIGMWESAVLMDAQLSTVIAEALHGVCKGYRLTLTGHSLGAGVATLLALRWKPLYPDLVSSCAVMILCVCVYIYGRRCTLTLWAHMHSRYI